MLDQFINIFATKFTSLSGVMDKVMDFWTEISGSNPYENTSKFL